MKMNMCINSKRVQDRRFGVIILGWFNFNVWYLLGTTYSCVSVYHAVTGEVDVLPDEDGHRCIPSVVAFRLDLI